MLPETIQLDHGAGGELARELLRAVVLPRLGNAILDRLEDSAVLPSPGGRLALTTDSFTVAPLFFPGGDIGRLAVCGTVNDLAMSGARPLYLTLGLILEEGLPVAVLGRVLDSLATAAGEARVRVVTGDTKVVPRGAADGLFINTAGLGEVPPGVNLTPAAIRPGDALLLSGPVGDHGLAILSSRAGLELEAPLLSDAAPLAGLVAAMLASDGEVHALRDPTRGGLAATLSELAAAAGVGMLVTEAAIPVTPAARAVADLLGLDPLYLANEGKLVAAVAPGDAGRVLAALRAHPLGREAALIGHATTQAPGRVVLVTEAGGRRVLDPLAGEPTVRIC